MMICRVPALISTCWRMVVLLDTHVAPPPPPHETLPDSAFGMLEATSWVLLLLPSAPRCLFII